jgi:hypothetical protein
MTVAAILMTLSVVLFCAASMLAVWLRHAARDAGDEQPTRSERKRLAPAERHRPAHGFGR